MGQQMPSSRWVTWSWQPTFRCQFEYQKHTLFNASDAGLQITRQEGIGGLYRGFGAILLTVIPANMCYFT